MGTALGVAALLVVSACGGESTLTASGTLGLVAVNAAEEDCSSGTDGYSDIQNGASVVVYGADGKKLAIGSLGEGAEQEGGYCAWNFSVSDVPTGQGPYGVEVASRGQVSFTEDKADEIVVSLG